MDGQKEISGYTYENSDLNDSHRFLLPALVDILNSLNLDPAENRIFEVGCGNGSVAHALSRLGYDITGVDPSEQGIAQANLQYPELKLYKGSAYEDLVAIYGQFPIVISLEVIEHVYSPRKYVKTIFNLLKEGGVTIISTPYHGYIKNLLLAVSNKMDNHFTVLWDHGHIKFWSIQTLAALLQETGFREIMFKRIGRIPPLAKSMIAVARK
ncbi:MAG: methyltransferase domain-containing protein [Nitrospirota bacterium]